MRLLQRAGCHPDPYLGCMPPESLQGGGCGPAGPHSLSVLRRGRMPGKATEAQTWGEFLWEEFLHLGQFERHQFVAFAQQHDPLACALGVIIMMGGGKANGAATAVNGHSAVGKAGACSMRCLSYDSIMRGLSRTSRCLPYGE